MHRFNHVLYSFGSVKLRRCEWAISQPSVVESDNVELSFIRFFDNLDNVWRIAIARQPWQHEQNRSCIFILLVINVFCLVLFEAISFQIQKSLPTIAILEKHSVIIFKFWKKIFLEIVF